MDGHSLSPVEIIGRVKWFDATKGYGFIVPNGNGPDILLSIAVLRRDGFLPVHDGAYIVVEVKVGDRGPQVLRVLAVQGADAARVQTRVAPTSGFEIVTLKWFNHFRGFGFLSRGDGAEDIFVHADMLRRHGLLRAQAGASLLARFDRGPKGLAAVEVRPFKASKVISSH